MKKLLLIAATATLGAASPALVSSAFAADATGTVNVSGTVSAKCADTGTSPVSIDLGELANSSGTVVSTFAGVTHANLTFACTSAKPTVTVAATPLKGPASPPPGYTNLVQYRATATAYLAAGGTNSVNPVVSTSGSALTTGTPVVLSSQLANAANNVQVDIDQPSSNGSLLVASAAGGYTGAVTVTVSPTN